MRLFFKHLVRTILARPLQPLILVLAILLSVAVSALSLGLGDALEEEESLSQAASYGSADITVRLGAGSDTRFLFASEAEEALGGDCVTVPLYELPLLLDGAAVSGAATELATYGEIFPLRFTAYGEITAGELPSLVLVSYRLAEEQGLSLGDSIEITLLNRKQNFTIAGITADRFVGTHDILFDMTAVTRGIAEGSVFLSALGDAFRPAGALYIKTGEALTTEEALLRLAAAPALSGATLLDVADHVSTVSATKAASVIVNIIILCTGLLSAAVTFSCFVILAAERREENAVFVAAGAKPALLVLLQYLEALLLFAIGAPLGLLLASPLLRLLVRLAGLSYARGRLGIGAMLTAAAIVLLSLLLTVTLFLLVRRGRHGIRTARWLCILPLCPLLLLLAAMPFVPGKLRLTVGVLALVFLFLFSATATPSLVRRLMRAYIARAEKRGAYRPARVYAAANVRSVSILKNTTALVAILLAVVLSALSMVVCSSGFLVGVRSLLVGEYVIPGATERAADRLVTCDAVSDVSSVYFATADFGDQGYIAVAASDLAALSPMLSLSRLPEGDELFLPRELAVAYSVGVGDPFSITVEGRELVLTVAEIVPMGVPMAILDAEAQGIPYNMLLVSGREGISEEQLLQELTAATASELTGILPTDSLLEMKAATYEAYNRSAVLLLLVIAIFSVIGILNNLLESYRERREEFALYTASGMSPTVLARMKALEVTASLLLGGLVALVTLFGAMGLLQYTVSGTSEYFINIIRFLTKR